MCERRYPCALRLHEVWEANTSSAKKSQASICQIKLTCLASLSSARGSRRRGEDIALYQTLQQDAHARFLAIGEGIIHLIYDNEDCFRHHGRLRPPAAQRKTHHVHRHRTMEHPAAEEGQWKLEPFKFSQIRHQKLWALVVGEPWLHACHCMPVTAPGPFTKPPQVGPASRQCASALPGRM